MPKKGVRDGSSDVEQIIDSAGKAEKPIPKEVSHCVDVVTARSLYDKEVRGAKTVEEVEGCFVMPEPEASKPLGPASGVEYKSSSDHNPATHEHPPIV